MKRIRIQDQGVGASVPGSRYFRPTRETQTLSASSSARRKPVSAGSSRCHVSLARSLPRGRDALQDEHHAGRTMRADDRYSHASRNSSFGESCSIDRADRNSSRSFHRGPSTWRQPR
jgi:hypothetical protein